VIIALGRANPSSANIREQIGSIQLLGFPSERYPKMKIKSEKQFSKLHDPSAEGGSSRLPFDNTKLVNFRSQKLEAPGFSIPEIPCVYSAL
jgi:hypothetical protein